MVETTTAVATQEELKAQLQDALNKNDWKAVAKISKQVAQAEAEAEKTERERTATGRQTLVEDIRKEFKVFLKPFKDKIAEVMGDGLWCVWNPDNHENPLEVRIVKKASRSSGGGGGGKKFAITTDELLSKYGAVEYKDGITFQKAYEADSSGNARYRVRVALLKKDGLI